MSERNIAFLIGMVIGILSLVAVALIQKLKKKKTWCEYDERQLQARGKAFQYGFVTLLFYNIFYAAIYGETEPSWCIPMFGIFLGIGISLVVMGGYAIWNDAFVQMDQSPLASYILFGGVGGVNLILAISHMLEGDFLTNGKIGYSGVNLVLGTAMLVLTGICIVRNCLDRGEEE